MLTPPALTREVSLVGEAVHIAVLVQEGPHQEQSPKVLPVAEVVLRPVRARSK